MVENSSKIICRSCHQANFTPDGALVPCLRCGKPLQHVHCPHCSARKFWSGNFPGEEGSLIECSTCSNEFRFFNCVKCRKTTFWKPFGSNELLSRTCPKCKRSVNMIACRSCSEYLVDPSAASLEKDHLYCHSCVDQNRILRCPHCSKSRIENNSNLNEFRTSQCLACRKSFGYLRCRHCDHTNLWPTINVNLSEFQCFSCGKDLTSSAVEKRLPHRASSIDLCHSPKRDISSFESRKCQYFEECLEFVKQLQWPRNVFNTKFDKCYCSRCYSDDQPSVLNVAGSKYVIPRRWAGFGLGVDPFLVDDLWKNYFIVYHGTTMIAAKSIVHHRQFLLPGDVLLDGTKLGIRLGHIPGKTFIYTSPSISYASLDAYSEAYQFRSPRSGRLYQAQIVLQARQKPGTFHFQGETVGWGSTPICPFIPNDRIEYFTDRRSSIIPCRLLVRLEHIT